MSSVSQHVDYQYIEGMLKNDAGMIKKIYKEHLPGIISLITKNNGSASDAEDVFQNALLVIYDKAQQPNFQLRSTFFSYLYSVCRFIWMRQLKKKYRNDITIEGDEGYSVEEDIEQIQIEEEKRQLFHEKLAQLGADCQKVMKLFFEGKTMKEIAEKAGYSLSYAKLKKYNCKEEFYKLIREDQRYWELVG